MQNMLTGWQMQQFNQKMSRLTESQKMGAKLGKQQSQRQAGVKTGWDSPNQANVWKDKH